MILGVFIILESYVIISTNGTLVAFINHFSQEVDSIKQLLVESIILSSQLKKNVFYSNRLTIPLL